MLYRSDYLSGDLAVFKVPGIFFSAMPTPTPPTWWRYSTKVEQNQAILDELPPLSFGSEFYMHHCSRDANRSPVAADHNNSMSFDVYLDERHYEVCAVASHSRRIAT